ncbi:unnamed protein product, partial [Laminaria digitata]
AIGGELALTAGLTRAVCARRARILRLLLTLDGEENRSKWANLDVEGDGPLLHYGAGYCCSATVSVLLEAGADEAARDFKGRAPQHVIGLCLSRDDLPMARVEEEAVAIRRMLKRCPAYRARSFSWPFFGEEEKDVGVSGTGGRGDGGD